MKKLTMSLFALLLVSGLFAQEEQDTTVYLAVDQMPRFPGCEQLDTTQVAKAKCAEQALLNFIYSNVNYPVDARMEGIEGTVVITFIVEKDGSTSNYSILRDIGGGCGEEALRVVSAMNEVGAVWIPGMQNGKAVRTKFNLPIRFKLEDPLPYTLFGADTVYTEFDTPARFLVEGDSLSSYLQKRIKFPAAYQDSCMIGDMELSLLVRSNGTAQVLEVSDYNNLGFDFQFELISAGNSTNGKWEAAQFEGRPVTTFTTATVLFEPNPSECHLLISSFERAQALAIEGLQLYNEGEVETGLGKLSEAVEMFPEHANFRYIRGQAYLNEDMVDEACEDFRIVRETLPMSVANDLMSLICR